MSLDPNPAPVPPPVAPPAAPPATPPAGVTPPGTPPGNGTPPNGDLWFYKPELGLDKETQDYLAGKNPPTLADAIKSARHYEQLVRDRNAMTAPAEGKVLEWEGWQKFGWDPDRTKYAIEKPAIKEGVPYADGFHEALTNGFHKGRVTPDQAKAVMAELTNAFNADHEASMAELARQDAAVKADMQREWGNQYNANLEKAKRAAGALLSKEQQAAIEDAFGAPELIRIFHKLGDLMGEEVLINNSNGGQGGFAGMSADQAKQELARQDADPDFVRTLADATHPLHEKNNARRRELFMMLAKSGQR